MSTLRLAIIFQSIEFCLLNNKNWLNSWNTYSYLHSTRIIAVETFSSSDATLEENVRVRMSSVRVASVDILWGQAYCSDWQNMMDGLIPVGHINHLSRPSWKAVNISKFSAIKYKQKKKTLMKDEKNICAIHKTDKLKSAFDLLTFCILPSIKIFYGRFQDYFNM